MWNRITYLSMGVTLSMWLGSIGHDTLPLATAQDPAGPGKPAAPVPAAPIQHSYRSEIDPANPAGPSLTRGLDRGHWGRTVILPIGDPGKVHPAYFSSTSILGPRPHPAPLTEAGDIEIEAGTITSHETNALTKYDWCDIAVQPLQTAFDLLILPVRMAIRPPWREVSPKQ